VTGLLVIMGSGETAPTMVKPHRAIFARCGDRAAALLDTPYGFQENADDISARAVGYFAASVGRTVGVVGWRTTPPPGLARERALAALREAGWLFAGPGSPTYALRHWRDTPVPDALAGAVQRGGAVVFASAAALTLGSHTVPVYEIYKAGFDPHWVPGLDLFRRVTGLPAVVVPHYDNAEGGHHDTRYCYLGERRLAAMEHELPDESFVLGVDEHTAVLVDLAEGTAGVLGNGAMTVRRRGRSVVYPSGSVVPLARLPLVDGGRPAAPDGTPAPAARGSPAGPAGGGRHAPPGVGDPAPAEAVAGAPAAGAPGNAAPSSPGAATSLRAAADAAAAAFDAALAERDVDGCVAAVLDLEQAMLDWSADTLTSDEGDHARATLRRMVLRLGELAVLGARDPAAVVAPYVTALLELRARARAGRDYASSDWIRDRLAEAGVEVRDSAGGSDWQLR
jgi:cyanophycinase-like exopeptidase